MNGDKKSPDQQYDQSKLSFKLRYESFKQFFSFNSQLFIISALTAPFDRLKIISQVKPDLHLYGYKNLDSSMSIINKIKKNGLLTFFKGTRVIFYRNFLTQLIFTKTFKSMSNSMDRYQWSRDLGMTKDLIAGIYSSICIFPLLYPLDLIKTKQQVELSKKMKVKYKRVYWSYRKISST